MEEHPVSSVEIRMAGRTNRISGPVYPIHFHVFIPGNPGRSWKAGEAIRTPDMHVGNVTLYH